MAKVDVLQNARAGHVVTHAEYPKNENEFAAHVVQLAAVAAAYVPGVQGTGTELPEGQKYPAGHGFALAAVVPMGQKYLREGEGEGEKEGEGEGEGKKERDRERY